MLHPAMTDPEIGRSISVIVMGWIFLANFDLLVFQRETIRNVCSKIQV
jgi:hypothetical protein